MRPLKFLMTLGAFLCAFPAVAADLDVLVPSLKQGGYVIVVRHVATDESQKDVHPFVFDDMRSQRQLSEHGRQVARDMGAAVRALRIPIGIVYTSQLYRAVETGTLISNQAVVPRKELTDTSAGSASGMANPSGANTVIGSDIRKLANTAPKLGTNNVLVTHKPGLAIDAVCRRPLYSG
jgi:phosphohistidine phosphatase SixA